MSFKEKVVVQILLMVAKFLAPMEWRKEIGDLATHISVNANRDGK